MVMMMGDMDEERRDGMEELRMNVDDGLIQITTSKKGRLGKLQALRYGWAMKRDGEGEPDWPVTVYDWLVAGQPLEFWCLG